MSRASDVIRRAARGAAMLSLLVLGYPAFAQRVPSVNDVYASRPTAARLGPDSDPARVVATAGRLLRESAALRYDVRLDGAEPVELWGSMLVARDGERWRATLGGHGADHGEVMARVAFEGREYEVSDLAGEGAEQGARIEGLQWLRPLAEAMVLPAWPEGAEAFTYLGEEERAGERCHRVHFVDPARGEHVYAWLSASDAMPRRLERVGPGPDGRPRVIAVEITNPSPALY